MNGRFSRTKGEREDEGRLREKEERRERGYFEHLEGDRAVWITQFTKEYGGNRF